MTKRRGAIDDQKEGGADQKGLDRRARKWSAGLQAWWAQARSNQKELSRITAKK